MADDKREESFAPRAGNSVVTLTIGNTTFTFSSPHGHFGPALNRVMSALPDLINRISPEEAGIGGEFDQVRSTAVSTTLTESDDLLICDCSAGSIIVGLLSATKAGKIFYIVKADDSANPVTVTCFGADDIEGASSVVLNSKYDKVILIANGTSSWLNLGSGAV